jgi:transcription antitermination protein NusB
MRRTDQRRAAVVALYQRDLTGRQLDALLDRETKEFTRELAYGVAAEQADLDALIERHAVGWTLDRIAPLERNILRVALYELLRREDVPAEVAIDEAIEAAKELCGADAPGFINGILGAAYREEGSASPR